MGNRGRARIVDRGRATPSTRVSCSCRIKATARHRRQDTVLQQLSQHSSSLSNPSYYTAATKVAYPPLVCTSAQGTRSSVFAGSTPLLGRTSNSDLTVPSPTLPLSTDRESKLRRHSTCPHAEQPPLRPHLRLPVRSALGVGSRWRPPLPRRNVPRELLVE